MKRAVITLGCLGLSIAVLMSAETIIEVDRAQAQAVVSDGTVNTTVTRSGNTFTIDNGTTSGSNLFHSFREFSIPTGGAAIFNNATSVQNIFSRVIGGTASSIDGVIQANGTANLFLLNPAGILFGSNASLNIGGSFVGTTAQAIKFADGIEFSAVNATNPPLLTMSVPIGLQMGQNPATIQVQGSGRNVSVSNPNRPVVRSTNPTGLQVQLGHTLALIGGNLELTNGNLTAEQGQVVLGAVGSGLVSLSAPPQGWTFNYGGVSSFRDIRLSQQSTLDASGTGGGQIQVQGANVSLSDGSLLLVQSLGGQSGDRIQVRASESLTIQGSTPDESVLSGIRTEQLGTGEGGILAIEVPRLIIQQGGGILSSTFGTGSSSPVTIQATEFTTVNGFSPLSKQVSLIGSRTFGSGAAGSMTLSTGQLTLNDGAQIGSGAFANTGNAGNAGDVTVNVEGTVAIIGVEPTFAQPSNIISGTISAGDSGRVTINTRRLTVQAGGRIGSTTVASGNAGSVTVNASESVEVQGKGSGTLSPSLINSSADIVDQAIQQLYGLPSLPSGDSGSATINTPRLSVTEGGIVAVKNDGTGKGGNLSINANTIYLGQQSRITAATQSGEGGNIFLQTQLLQLRHNSAITANANGSGNGGNVVIASPIILGLENSDIVANAVEGRGGNITLTTQGMIGLVFRNTLTPQADPTNDITASSEFNVNGTVQINNVGVDPNSGLVELPANIIDPTQRIAKGCDANSGSQFVITGRGGMPQNPAQEVRRDRTWNDLRDLSAFHKPAIAQTPTPMPMIVQATDWRRNPQTGKVELLATQSARPTPSATCAHVSNSAGNKI